MITQAAFGRAERQMMLHAVAGENASGAIVAMNGQRDGHGTLGIFEAVAFGIGNFEMVGDRVELLAGHAESRAVVNIHSCRRKI